MPGYEARLWRHSVAGARGAASTIRVSSSSTIRTVAAGPTGRASPAPAASTTTCHSIRTSTRRCVTTATISSVSRCASTAGGSTATRSTCASLISANLTERALYARHGTIRGTANGSTARAMPHGLAMWGSAAGRRRGRRQWSAAHSSWPVSRRLVPIRRVGTGAPVTPCATAAVGLTGRTRDTVCAARALRRCAVSRVDGRNG